MVAVPEVPQFTNLLNNQPLALTPGVLTPTSTLAPNTTSYTIQATDYLRQIHSFSAGGTLTLTFPSTLPSGFAVFVSVTANSIILTTSGGPVFIVPSGNSLGTIGSTYTLSVSNQYQSAMVMFDGTNFWLTTTQGSGQLISIDTIISGGGSVILTGAKTWLHIPVALSIGAWRVSADQSGSITIDVQKVHDGAISGAASIIGAGNTPTLSSAQFNEAALSGWTTNSLIYDDWLVFVVTGTPSSVTQITLDLTCTRV